MLEEGNNIGYIINTRAKVEVSFVGLERIDRATRGYGLFLILLTAQKARRGIWWLIIRAITIFVGPRLRVVDGRHGEIESEITRDEERRKQIIS